MDLIRLGIIINLNVCYIFEQILKGFGLIPTRTNSGQHWVLTWSKSEQAKIPSGQNPDTAKISTTCMD